MINCLIVRLLFELGLDYKKCVKILVVFVGDACSVLDFL